MTAAEINAALDSGRTVYICTHLRCWKLTAKARDQFRAAGQELVKEGRDGRPYMARGRHWDDIGYCAIKVV